ncbi:hypothetical protein HW532_17385 [Kaustia mangrovi]|uniref:Uncharacterized protein n=1 Tax=Kaustia mangrovi TaxID=2593653 RepID=A0A7S8C6Y9_9HYPH|nr:hypothetical protein [Kaustia mangrovi]QPC44314.1 hypothetical protein HW532_17385 [Kaustia mangrovi]
MVQMDDGFSCFSQTGVSFDEIVLEGASGGVDAVIRYLQSRRQILLRDSSQISLGNEDPAHYERAVEVVDDALALLEQIKELNIRRELEEASNPSQELPEDVADMVPETADGEQSG